MIGNQLVAVLVYILFLIVLLTDGGNELFLTRVEIISVRYVYKVGLVLIF